MYVQYGNKEIQRAMNKQARKIDKLHAHLMQNRFGKQKSTFELISAESLKTTYQ